MNDPIAALKTALADACAALATGAAVSLTLERPPKPELGDYSTNAALLLAPLLQQPPREVAAQLGDLVLEALGPSLDRVEVAGPGFLNLFLAEDWFRDAVEEINAAGSEFGAGVASERAERILVEFVSANPTGPITVAGGRHAAYGDSLARILSFAGHEVGREYYVNDAGRQIELFGESIAARLEGVEVPEDGYRGDYVVELAEKLGSQGVGAGEVDRLAARGVELMLESIGASLARFRVGFDRWSSELALVRDGAREAATTALTEQGIIYESDGAVWMRTTALGDDKDRVLRRADGEPTYFAADIAYHRDKLERGWQRLIDVLGADHHGYVPRLRAAVASLGGDGEGFEAPIMQLVQIVEGGERTSMSKRRGEFVSLDSLLDDIGVDAARFFLVQRSHETPIDLDLELARSRSNENPVYYVQYAHARICQIFARAEGAPGRGGRAESEGSDEGEGEPEVEIELGAQPAEKALIGRLLELPAQIERAERRREPHSLGAYSREIAGDFHAFYRDCPVVKAPEPLRGQRLALCAAARTNIATVLGLLGIEAPEEM